jgi:hypothetical protein
LKASTVSVIRDRRTLFTCRRWAIEIQQQQQPNRAGPQGNPVASRGSRTAADISR